MDESELEHEQTRSEVPASPRTIADGLERENTRTFISGGERTASTPPEPIHFRAGTGDESSWLGGDYGRSLRMEMGWEADAVQAEDEPRIVHEADAPGMIREADRP